MHYADTIGYAYHFDTFLINFNNSIHYLNAKANESALVIMQTESFQQWAFKGLQTKLLGFCVVTYIHTYIHTLLECTGIASTDELTAFVCIQLNNDIIYKYNWQ